MIIKTPRKLKKAIKKAVISIDVSAIPRGLDVDRFFDIYKETGIMFYDSRKGEAPKVISFGNKRIRRKIYKE